MLSLSYFTFSATLALLIPTALSQTCYDPGGAVDSDSTSCGNGDAFGHYSTCCGPGWQCTAANVCVQTDGGIDNTYARGGCTDPTFEDPYCPRFCLAHAYMDLCFQNSTTSYLCCGEYDQCTCWKDPTYQLGPLSVIASIASAMPPTPTSVITTSYAISTITLSQTVWSGILEPVSSGQSGVHTKSPSSTTTSSSGVSNGAKNTGVGTGAPRLSSQATAHPTASSSPSGGLDSGTKAAIALAAVLGFLFIVGMAAAVYFIGFRRRKQGLRTMQVTPSSGIVYPSTEYSNTEYNAMTVPPSWGRHEMSSQPRGPSEMDANGNWSSKW